MVLNQHCWWERRFRLFLEPIRNDWSQNRSLDLFLAQKNQPDVPTNRPLDRPSSTVIQLEWNSTVTISKFEFCRALKWSFVFAGNSLNDCSRNGHLISTSAQQLSDSLWSPLCWWLSLWVFSTECSSPDSTMTTKREFFLSYQRVVMA